MVLMVPMLIVVFTLLSKIKTRVTIVKGWVNSCLAFMGQLYIGFYKCGSERIFRVLLASRQPERWIWGSALDHDREFLLHLSSQTAKLVQEGHQKPQERAGPIRYLSGKGRKGDQRV